VRSLIIYASILLLAYPAASAAQDVDELPPGLPALGLAKDCSYEQASIARDENSEATRLAKAIHPALTGSGALPVSLSERMRIRRVPGVSIAVIRNGRLSWALGFGVRDTSTCERVTTDTVFQAGSISKSLTAVLAMQAVDQGRLELDRNINDYLLRWKLTPGADVPANTTVTLRQLLGHTAAVSVPDSGGVRPGNPVYGIVQALQGQAPAKGPPVHVIGTPGQDWSYSNGGYLVVQLALEDSLSMSFGDLARERILEQLKMKLSSFDQPPSRFDLATGHSHWQTFHRQGLWRPGAGSRRSLVNANRPCAFFDCPTKGRQWPRQKPSAPATGIDDGRTR
jgi:CubicO group peptidase (beta-lactamase class C family)